MYFEMFRIIVGFLIEIKLCKLKRNSAFCSVIVTKIALEPLLQTVQRRLKVTTKMYSIPCAVYFKTVSCVMFRAFQMKSVCIRLSSCTIKVVTCQCLFG